MSLGNGERNIDLCDYISRKAKQHCCGYAPTPEEVMDGACMELGCDCVISELYAVATQAAELRERLKEYEDAEEMSELTSNSTTEVSTERPIEVITEEINFYKATAGAAILEIGKRLNEAKSLLNHGEWGEWLAEKVDFSEATAQRFMRLAKEYSNPSPVTDLGVSKALVLLALPDFERDEFVSEKHTVNGEEKTVAEMSKRELEQAVKEKNEALKRESETKQRLEKLESELAAAKESEEESNALLEDAKAEIEKLKSAPLPEVENVKLSDEQLKEFRDKAAAEKAEEIEKLNAKIEQLKEQNKKAAEEKKKLSSQKKALEQRCENIAEESIADREKLQKEIESLKAKMLVSNSETMTEFKIYFNDFQALGNKMLGCIEKTMTADNAEAGKLKKAVYAICSKFAEVVK